MTDLLSVEDIKKALGAFAGEQRAPLLSPLSTCTHHPGPCTPPSLHPVGRGGAGSGGPPHFPNSSVRGHLDRAGRPGTLPERTKTCGCQRLGPGPRTRPGSLRALRDFPFRHRAGCRHVCLLPTPHLDPPPRPRSGQGSSHPAVGMPPPLSERPARGSEPLSKGPGNKVTFPKPASCSALPNAV